jgi:prevent-host-death family protein
MLFKNISETKAEISALVAAVEKGEEVLISRAGKPVARIVAYKGATQPRKPGALKGKIQISEDFDAPLPPEILAGFGLQ